MPSGTSVSGPFSHLILGEEGGFSQYVIIAYSSTYINLLATKNMGSTKGYFRGLSWQSTHCELGLCQWHNKCIILVY